MRGSSSRSGWMSGGLFKPFSCAALLWGLVALGLFWSARLSAQDPAEKRDSASLSAAIVLQSALEEAIAGSEKSIVSIARTTTATADPQAIPSRYGTGVVIGKGLILTFYHVIDDRFSEGEDSIRTKVRDTIYVWTTDRRVFQAQVKAADPRSDLAVLSIDAQDLPTIRMAKPETVGALKKGQIVIALGNPQAIARDGSASASWGIIANLSRKLGPKLTPEDRPTRPSLLHEFGTLIQTDAKLNFGTSGGALLNLQGEMIGLTTALAAAPGYDHAAGYAVPLDETFRRVVETLKQGREVEYGFLGIVPQNLELAEQLAGRQGMRIGDVRESPAAMAGLRNDDIVTEINGQRIYDADGLMLHVGKLPVESKVTLTVRRDNRDVTLNPVTLGKYPVRGVKIVTDMPPAWRGLRVDYPTAEFRFLLADWSGREYQAIKQGCVVISEVEPDSPAALAGLRAGALISHVQGKPITSPREFRQQLQGKSGPVELTLPSLTRPVVIEPDK